MIHFLDEIKKEELNGKKIFLRVDFNVPIENKKIGEPFRIKATKETINYLLENGANIMLVSHISAADSFLEINEEIGDIIGKTLTLVPHNEIRTVPGLFKICPVVLLDNVRSDEREEKNDPEFARILAQGFDIYINDAFAVSHRDQASVSAITRFLPSYGGFLLRKETENLSKAVNAPTAGKTIILGGAKISTKLPVVKNFIDKADHIIIGGAIANNFFKTKGIEIGASVVDNTKVEISDPRIILPEDILVTDDETGKTGTTHMPLGDIKADQLIVDIGPESAKKFAEIIAGSEMVVWNGPVGLSEIDAFAGGTRVIAQAATKAKYSIIGGGDTIAAIDKLELLDKYTFVSTGGGAMLEFLAGEKLPALAALGYYD